MEATGSCLALVAGFSLIAAPAAPAHADTVEISAELPAAVPVSAPQEQRFGIGGMPGLGVFVSPAAGAAVGLRGRAGALADRAEMDPTRADVGAGGVAAGSLALRLRPGTWIGAPGLGGWIEVGGGVAVTGETVRPAWELALGWRFELGRISAGPSLRWLHIDGVADSLDPRGADLALVGIDIGFSGSRSRPRTEPALAVAPVAPAPPAATPAAPPVFTRDVDRLVDSERRCPIALPDADEGCARPDDLVVEDHRVVLPERILFDFNRARVKRAGRKRLQLLAFAWTAHPEWRSIRIEGHADQRGDERYNQELSELRAERVRAVLLELGVPAEALTSCGFGARRPRVPGNTASALDANRRVELVIVTGEPRDTP